MLSPLVMFIAIGVMHYFASGKTRAFDYGARMLGIVLGVSALGFVFHQLTGMGGDRLYDASETLKWIGVALGLLVWSGFSILSAIQGDFKKKLVLFSAAPVLVYLCVHLSLPNQAFEGRAPQKLLERNRARVQANSLVVSDEYLVHAVCWVFNRDDIYLLDKPGELDYGLANDPAARLFSLNRFRDLVEGPSHRPEVILILEADRYEKYLQSLPPPVYKDQDKGVVFWVF
ncbi:MAG: hypothetical protein U5R49_08800 [Deltaproteobacteria bacterium]|nr:hypothetical protein [Deltaproteobacteria bacterium]